MPAGSSPTTGRRRKNTEGSEVSDDVEKPIDRQRSFSCTRLKQQVEIFNFISKLGDRAVYCGKCVGMYHVSIIHKTILLFHVLFHDLLPRCRYKPCFNSRLLRISMASARIEERHKFFERKFYWFHHSCDLNDNMMTRHSFSRGYYYCIFG